MADSKAAPPAVAAAFKVEMSVMTNMARKDCDAVHSVRSSQLEILNLDSSVMV